MALTWEVSLIVEAAFHRDRAEPRLRALGEHANLAHLSVAVAPSVAAARYRTRFDAGLRHPAHGDGLFAPAMERPDFPWSRYDLESVGDHLTVDASDGWSPGLDHILDFVETCRG